MTPSVKAFTAHLIEAFEKRIAELESKVQKLTPQNSSLPPSTQHPRRIASHWVIRDDWATGFRRSPSVRRGENAALS